MNIINGGEHADNLIDIQEFMVMPLGMDTFSDALRAGAEIFQSLKKELSAAGHNTNVRDEGGFAPGLASTEEALDFIMKATEKAGYRPGEDIYIALDAAATEFYKDGKYNLSGENKILGSDEMVDYLASLVNRFPIVSIEDGMAEDDWDGWRALSDAIGHKCQLVGDDLFVTRLGAMVWGYHSLITDSPDGRGWYICEDDGVKHLAAIAIPSEFVLSSLSNIADNYAPLLRPGEVVGVETKIGRNSGDNEELTNEIRAAFIKKLAANEIEVRPGERKLFRLTLQVDSDGRDPYRLVSDGKELIIPNNSLKVQVELVVNQRTVWKSLVATELSEINYKPNMSSADAAADLVRQQETALLHQLEELDGQALTYPPVGHRGFGTSYQDIKGERLSVDTQYRF